MTKEFSMIRMSRVAFSVVALAMAMATPQAVAAEDLARGRQLYDLCAQCHGANGDGRQLYLAPAIAGLDGWYVKSQLYVFKSGARGTNWQDVGGLRMHPMSRWLRSDADVAAVSAYVAALPKVNPVPVVVGGNIEAGKTLYATCGACHGAAGEGDEAKNSPPLANMSDWYLVSALEKYKAGIRGSNPQNTNAVLMRGMSNLLVNDQAIKDVVAYITTLNN